MYAPLPQGDGSGQPFTGGAEASKRKLVLLNIRGSFRFQLVDLRAELVEITQ